MIDIIIPTKLYPHYKNCIAALERNTPLPHRLFLVTEGNSWSQAVNIGITKSSDSDNDVVIMDDDIEVLPGWLNNIEEYKEKADIIGFKLLDSEGRIQHAGCQVVFTLRHKLLGRRPYALINRGWRKKDSNHAYGKEEYLAHVTTSLAYIKRYVLKDFAFDETFPGLQYEDTDFSFRAILKGYRVLYTPNKAIHHDSLTKKKDPLLARKTELNYNMLYERWFANKDFIKFLRSKHFIFYQLLFSQAGTYDLRFLLKYLGFRKDRAK